MSVSSGGLGTIYSRLPQSTSDIESSEDEISQHENLIFYRKLGTPKKTSVKTEETSKFVILVIACFLAFFVRLMLYF